MKLTELPPSVANSIRSHYPNEKNILINKELHFRMNLYEVKFNVGNHQDAVLFDGQGKPFGTEKRINAQQLPVAVNKKLERIFAHYSIQYTLLLKHPDGRVEYVVDVKGDGSEWELAMTPSGNIVAKNRSEM